jgi:hypothetical protein
MPDPGATALSAPVNAVIMGRLESHPPTSSGAAAKHPSTVASALASDEPRLYHSQPGFSYRNDVPLTRFDDALEDFARHVRKAGDEVSLKLGYRPRL